VGAWGGVRLDDAVEELECQEGCVFADGEGISADDGGGDGGEVVWEEGLG
jgi:hypothetical protein